MLRTLLALLFLAGLSLALTASAADEKKDDKKAGDIDGEYTVVSATKAGKAENDDFLKAVEGITIKDGVFSIKLKMGDKAETKTAKIKVDATKKPAEVDITPSEGPMKDKSIPAIFAHEKDELKLAWVEGGRDKIGPRPKDFTSNGENNVTVLTLKKKQ